MVISSYRDLRIWQESKALTVSIYKSTRQFPPPEIYGLTSQIRRAAVSMPSNIAEGFRRKSKAEKLQFLRIAHGSGAELETQLEIAYDLGYLKEFEYNKLAGDLDMVMRMMNKAIASIQQ